MFVFVAHPDTGTSSPGTPRYTKCAVPQTRSRRWDGPGRIDGSHRQEGGDTWSRLGYLPGLGQTYSSPPPRLGRPCPAGVSSWVAVPEMRRTCHRVPDLPALPTALGVSGACRSGVVYWPHFCIRLPWDTLLFCRLRPAGFPAQCSACYHTKSCARRGGP